MRTCTTGSWGRTGQLGGSWWTGTMRVGAPWMLSYKMEGIRLVGLHSTLLQLSRMHVYVI